MNETGTSAFFLNHPEVTALLALIPGTVLARLASAGIARALVMVVLTRVGQVPATASSIILTTVTDVAGFFAFLGTATLLSFML